VKEPREALGLKLEGGEQGSEEALVVTARYVRSLLNEAPVGERLAAIDLLLQHDLVDQAAGLHAAEGEEAIGPGVGGLADELDDAVVDDLGFLLGGQLERRLHVLVLATTALERGTVCLLGDLGVEDRL
jgi:hypothetical protein